MAQDQIFWKFFFLMLRDWWYGISTPATIAASKRPDFPLDSKSASGTALFDANPWTEEVVVLLHHKIKNISEQSSSPTISLVHSCLLLPIEQAIFNPRCPVIKTQQSLRVGLWVEVEPAPEPLAAAELTTADLTVWQAPPQEWLATGSSDTRRPSLLFAAPFVSFLVLLLLTISAAGCVKWLLPSEAKKQNRKLAEALARSYDTVKSQKALIATQTDATKASQRTIKEQLAMIENEKAMVDNASKKIEEQQASLSGFAAQVNDLEKTVKGLQDSRDAYAKKVAEKEATIALLKATGATLERAMLAKSAKELAEKEAIIANLKASLEQANLNKGLQDGDKDEVNVLEAAVKSRDTKIEELENAVATVKSSVAAKDDKIREQQKALATLNTVAKSKDNKVKDQQTSVAALEVSTKAKDTTIREQKNALEASSKAKEAASTEHKNALAALEATVKAKEGKIKEQKAALATLEALGKTKDSTIEEQKTALEVLKLSAATKDQEISEQKGLVNALNSSVAAKDAPITEHKNALATLKTEKKEAVRGRQGELDQLNKQVKETEEKRLETEAKANKALQKEEDALAGLEISVKAKEQIVARQRQEIEQLQHQVKTAEEAREKEERKRHEAVEGLQRELDQVKQELKASKEESSSTVSVQQRPSRPQLQLLTTFSEQGELEIKVSDERSSSFAQTRIESPRLMAASFSLPLAPAPVTKTFEEELQFSFCNTSGQLDVSPPTTPRVNVNVNGLAVAATPARVSGTTPAPASTSPSSGSASAVGHIFNEPKVKKQSHPAGDLLKSIYASPSTSATVPLSPASVPLPASPAAAPSGSTPTSSDVACECMPTGKDHIVSEPKVKYWGPGACDLLKSNHASPVTDTASPSAASVPLPDSATASPSGSPITVVSTPVAKDHIFSVPRVKNQGHPACDLLSSKYAPRGPAQVPSGPASSPLASTPASHAGGLNRSGSVGARAGGPSSGVPGAPTRLQTKVERVIDAQAAARGLPETTPNRPKTQAERDAEAKSRSAAE